jgi:hypothetical protein|tara:strand:+ start:1617 stop:2957 length:1341 start_codon:yes stop_codon:yes gene_type:complete
MKKLVLLCTLLTIAIASQAQTNPAITSWLQNTTVTGTYYVAGNSTAIPNNILVNCQQVEYSVDYAYITATGIPAYTTGPFQDGNPSQASNQNAIFQMPLNPQQNTGTSINTNGGNIGIFINGVALFDYRDGVAWNPTTNALCGGPGNPPCPGGPTATQDWNRDAIPAENAGFDCAKGHPAMGNYHHHQNPSAFDLDMTPASDVCNLYDADGLYVLDATAHSPLIGFAYDGFPIYGAYAYTNTDGTGGIERMKSSYELQNITTRTNGPAVNATYILGYFREDYVYVANAAPDYLDEHNGRFCITPEYPNGTYAYFATIDADLNSAYPYAVGPTYYGVSSDRKVTSINETTTTYTTTNTNSALFESFKIGIYPNPATDLIAIQFSGLVEADFQLDLIDVTGRIIESKSINKGQTIAYFDVQTVYNGTYFVSISNGNNHTTRKVIIARD